MIVPHHAGGCYRISNPARREARISSDKVDPGEIERWQVQHQPAPPLIAEWRDGRYRVMGQSADGEEVRLPITEEEQPEIVGAAIDDVSLVEADVTLETLPILIGDESIIFPGVDFRGGQGKILPKANEWMWLP